MPRHLTIENINNYPELEKILAEADQNTETIEFVKSPAIGYASANSLSHLPNVSHFIFTDTPLGVGSITRCVSKHPEISELTISSVNVEPNSEETLEGNLSTLVSKLPHVTQIHVINRGPGTWSKNTDLEDKLTKLIASRPAVVSTTAGTSGDSFFTERKSNKDEDQGPKLDTTMPDI